MPVQVSDSAMTSSQNVAARFGGVIAVVLLALAIALAGAMPAQANADDVDNYLQVSHDGENFSAAGDIPLFEKLGYVVPGDNGTDSIWVKNASPERAWLSLALVAMGAQGSRLAEASTLTFSVPEHEERSMTFAQAMAGGPTTSLTDDWQLDAGEVVRVDVNLRVNRDLGSAPGDGGDAGQGESFSFRLTADLAQLGPGTPSASPSPEPRGSPSPAPTDPGEDLPITGTQVSLFILFGVLLTMGGISLILKSRRRKETRG